jgi:hypothetical protein
MGVVNSILGIQPFITKPLSKKAALKCWDGSCLSFEANFMAFIVKICQFYQKSQYAPNLMIH